MVSETCGLDISSAVCICHCHGRGNYLTLNESPIVGCRYVRTEAVKLGRQLFAVLDTVGGLKEQVQQSVNFSEHANHETGHSRLRNIVTTWRLNEPSLPD